MHLYNDQCIILVHICYWGQECELHKRSRIPTLKIFVDRNICPSVIEITLVGMDVETSPTWVSIMGRAIILPSPKSKLNLGSHPALIGNANETIIIILHFRS